MIKTRGAVAALATVALAAALSTATFAAAETDAPGLTGIEWNVEFDHRRRDHDRGTRQTSTATLFMEAGGAGGSGGCNTWFGDYRVDGSLLSFGPVGSTQMFCEGPGQETEDAYLAALE